MTTTVEMKGVCGACGTRMTLKGFRNAQKLPDVSPFSILRRELKAARAIRGKSLRTVAWECGLSNAFISQVETGKCKDITTGAYNVLKNWIEREP